MGESGGFGYCTESRVSLKDPNSFRFLVFSASILLKINEEDSRTVYLFILNKNVPFVF